MDNVHGPHGTAGIVKHPLLVEVDVRRQLLVQLIRNVLDHGARVVPVLGQRALGHVVEMLQVQHVKLVEVLLQHVENRRQEPGQQREDAQQAADARGGVFRPGSH